MSFLERILTRALQFLETNAARLFRIFFGRLRRIPCYWKTFGVPKPRWRRKLSGKKTHKKNQIDLVKHHLRSSECETSALRRLVPAHVKHSDSSRLPINYHQIAKSIASTGAKSVLVTFQSGKLKLGSLISSDQGLWDRYLHRSLALRNFRLRVVVRQPKTLTIARLVVCQIDALAREERKT